MARLPFLLSIVHGGAMLPRELAPRLALSSADVFFDSNPWTREIFAMGELVQGRLEVEVARAVIDLDRDPGHRPPDHEDGVVKTVTRYGKKIWTDEGQPTSEEVQRLIDRYHRPYHEILERTASRGGVRMGIDCHSMAPVGAPLDPDPGQVRPIFCLGNLGDEKGEGEAITCKPAYLHALAGALAEEFPEARSPEGLPLVTLNQPFSGDYILRRHGHGRTPWLQLTINRSLVLKKEPEDPASADDVPDSEREVIADLRVRILRTLRRFAEKVD
jgi:formiminoglutamase